MRTLKYLFLFFFIAIANVPAFAQSEPTGLIRIECPVNQYLDANNKYAKDYEQSFEIHATISGHLKNGELYDTAKVEFGRMSTLALGPFPHGVYTIKIIGQLFIRAKKNKQDDPDRGYTLSVTGGEPSYFETNDSSHNDRIYEPSYYYFVKVIKDIVIEDGAVTLIEGPFQSDCTYFKTFAERTCPKCNKSDHVVPILYDDYLEDKLKYKADTWYYVPRKFNGCEPMAYCKDDKLEF